MDVKFFDSLYEGDSANGCKLGMGLTGGDFWPRILGASMLYRGSSMGTIDFDQILAVTDPDTGQISVPVYLSHNSNSVYFYVIRRANSCGQQEQTLSASVKVAIDANGDLSKVLPSSIFLVKVEQIEDDKIKLIWFYSPLEQESEPVYFNIYSDNGSGQIDYQNAITKIDYKGVRFYSYTSGTLSESEYLFTIKVEDAAGMEDSSLLQLSIQLNSNSPPAINVLSIETT